MADSDPAGRSLTAQDVFGEIKRNPGLYFLGFLLSGLPIYIATLWGPIVGSKTIPDWLAEHGWPRLRVLVAGWIVAALAIMVVIVVRSWLNAKRLVVEPDLAEHQQSVNEERSDKPDFPLEKIRVISEAVPSSLEAFPFGLKLTIQTNIPISPVWFEIECSEVIGTALAYPAGLGASSAMASDPAGKSKTFSYRQDSPPFTPQNPILVFLSTARRATCKVTRVS